MKFSSLCRLLTFLTFSLSAGLSSISFAAGGHDTAGAGDVETESSVFHSEAIHARNLKVASFMKLSKSHFKAFAFTSGLLSCANEDQKSNPLLKLKATELVELADQVINESWVTDPKHENRFQMNELEVLQIAPYGFYFQRETLHISQGRRHEARKLFYCNMFHGTLSEAAWILPKESKNRKENRDNWQTQINILERLSTTPDKTGLVEILNFSVKNGIIERFYEVGSLESLLTNIDCTDRSRQFVKVRVLRLFKQIAIGLTTLHDRGIVHSDLSPGNILRTMRLTGKESAVIADFGMSFDVSDTRTLKPRFGGAQWWIAPEVYLGPDQNLYSNPNNYKLRDVYSMAAMLAAFVKPELYSQECREEVNKPEVSLADVSKMIQCLRADHAVFQDFATHQKSGYEDSLTALILDGIQPDPLKRISSHEWQERLEAIH